MNVERERERSGEFGMDETDERALESLFETRSALPPAIAWNVSDEVSATQVERRLRRLERVGLVERAGADRERDYYRVTEDGVAYLAGLFDLQTEKTE